MHGAKKTDEFFRTQNITFLELIVLFLFFFADLTVIQQNKKFSHWKVPEISSQLSQKFNGTECYEWLLPIPHILTLFHFKYPIYTTAFPRNHCLTLSFRSTYFMHSFPLCVPNARLKIYHRSSSAVTRNEGRKMFGPTHELSSTARISGFIILAQILDISSLFSPMAFPIINCLEINT
jgi:hypothetical protein